MAIMMMMIFFAYSVRASRLLIGPEQTREAEEEPPTPRTDFLPKFGDPRDGGTYSRWGSLGILIHLQMGTLAHTLWCTAALQTDPPPTSVARGRLPLPRRAWRVLRLGSGMSTERHIRPTRAPVRRRNASRRSLTPSPRTMGDTPVILVPNPPATRDPPQVGTTCRAPREAVPPRTTAAGPPVRRGATMEQEVAYC